MSEPSIRLTVSDLTSRIKNNLEQLFPFVEVEGEISNFRPAASGHVYFTLKDDTASLSAVMFRGRAASLTFSPEDGQEVVASGGISVYARRGNYQIIVERMSLSGEGRILAELEERKRRFAAEGLFDEARKRRLPILPERVAVVTSPTGAALRDILQVLGRRNAGVDVVVCPTPVQGESAGVRIAKMISIASEHRLGDVIIVGRGGGSLEDLLPFSDEQVVRAIYNASIPVISAVGHEIDWALSDFVADQRAPTPSAAAELVATSREDLRNRLMESARRIVAVFSDRFLRSRLLLRQFSPTELHRVYESIALPILQGFDRLREDLRLGMADRTREHRHALELARQQLMACSPYEVLNRGYAIVRGADGSVLTHAERASPGDRIHVKLSAGSLGAEVKEIREDEEL